MYKEKKRVEIYTRMNNLRRISLYSLVVLYANLNYANLYYANLKYSAI